MNAVVYARFSSHRQGEQSIEGNFPGGSAGKESACNVGDLGLIPGLGRSPREGKGYPLQYLCLLCYVYSKYFIFFEIEK